MIIFESILTTFEASFIFWGSWGSIKNWLKLKIEPPLSNLALLNPWNSLYHNHVAKTAEKHMGWLSLYLIYSSLWRASKCCAKICRQQMLRKFIAGQMGIEANDVKDAEYAWIHSSEFLRNNFCFGNLTSNSKIPN